MQPAFEIAEEHGDGLDPLFVGQVFEALLLDFADSDAVPALLLRLQIQVFEFVVGECQEITQFIRHGCSFSLLFVVSKMLARQRIKTGLG